MEKTITSAKYERLRVWLRKERKSRNITMRTLGEKLGRPHQFVGKVESGERRLDVYEFVQYCQALGVSEQEGLYLLSDDYSNGHMLPPVKSSGKEKSKKQ